MHTSCRLTSSMRTSIAKSNEDKTYKQSKGNVSPNVIYKMTKKDMGMGFHLHGVENKTKKGMG